MVVVNRRNRKRPERDPVPAGDDGFVLPPLIELSEEEAREFFGREARRLVVLSGEEFLRRYDRGHYAGIEEDEFVRAVVELSFLIPFGR